MKVKRATHREAEVSINQFGPHRFGVLAALVFSQVVFWVSLGRSTEAPPAPATPKKPVTDTYQGVLVAEDYRWLEDYKNPEVRNWSEAQNQLTRAFLDKLPGREQIQKRLKGIYGAQSASYFGLQYRRGTLFALKFQPPKEQPFLVTLASADDPASEQVVVNPNTLNPKGTTAIDFYSPSLDGKLVAVSLSEGGSEDGTVHVYEVSSGKELSDIIPRVNYPTAGGDVAWNPDGSGFYYTRYPQGSERSKEDINFYQQVWFHKLGTPAGEDVYVIGKEFPRIAEIQLETTDDGGYLLVTVSNGDGGEYAHYLLDPSGKWTEITRFADWITRASLGPDGALSMLSLKDSPRGKILRLPLENPVLEKASVFIAEDAELVIEHFVPTANRLYVIDQVGGPSEIRVFDHEGKLLSPVELAPVSSVGQVLRMGGDEVLISSSTYLTPTAWYQFNPPTAVARRTALFETSPADFSDCEVVREFATSKDGAKVPVNIIRLKGTKLNGKNPTLLTGYGGYGISLRPNFSNARRVWLEQGGVWVIANLRGGGEYGEAWHKAGNLTKKQNVFDDFAACAQYLIKAGYTNPAKLVIEGGSNGGLLMGAALTQHPDLFAAVVSHVGVYDMLRVELDPNGAFNVTEFGTVKDPEQFKALYAYSPYHHVKDKTAYPAVFLLTGENDGRVNPANSRKMAARLQAATGSKHPILLWTSRSGHGIGSSLSEKISRSADVFAFMFDQLGVPYLDRKTHLQSTEVELK
ncbi:MAG: prolyl oligopeptidase family serine peptidase [candidate division Zixibacteria bacterium]|nr:prolyl oligopeptidase family serine peptidase [candidate division Zixibacteria bacterium]